MHIPNRQGQISLFLFQLNIDFKIGRENLIYHYAA